MGLRRRRQPHLLQREQRHAAGRRQEVVRRPAGGAEGALQDVEETPEETLVQSSKNFSIVKIIFNLPQPLATGQRPVASLRSISSSTFSPSQSRPRSCLNK